MHRPPIVPPDAAGRGAQEPSSASATPSRARQRLGSTRAPDDALEQARREAVRGAWPTAILVLVLTLIAAAAAGRVETTTTYVDHLGALPLVPAVLTVGALSAAAAVAPAVWPRTVEADLLARTMRGAVGFVALGLLVGMGLRAPNLAGLAAVAPLLAPLAAFVHHGGRRIPHRAWLLPTAAAVALAASAAGVLAFVPSVHGWTRAWLYLAVLLLAYVLVVPLALRVHRRTVAGEPIRLDPLRRVVRGEGPHQAAPDPGLDLDPGTLDPGAGWFRVGLTLASLLFVALVVAPGVPAGSVLRWTFTAALLPILLRSLLSRHGVASSGRAIAPHQMRAHGEIVAHLSDRSLEELDDLMQHFVARRQGRRRLARALAQRMGPVVPEFTEPFLRTRLARAPRGWWRSARDARASYVRTLVDGPPRQPSEGSSP